MSFNHITARGALTEEVARQINLSAIGDVSRPSAQFLVDSNTTGTTLTNVSGMVTDTLPPGTYELEANLIVTATTNSGFKAAFKQGTAGMVSAISATVTSTSASAVAQTTQFTTTTDASTFVGATSAYLRVQVRGTITLALSGTIQLQAAQNASHADDTTVEVGSTMRFRKIA